MVQKIVNDKPLWWVRIGTILFLVMLPMSSVLAGPTEDLASILQNFQRNLGPLYKLVVATAYIMGLWFIVDSVMRLKKLAQAKTMMSTHATMGKPLILMGIGACLLYFPTFVNVSVQSLWMYGSSHSILRYPSEPSVFSAFINPLIDTIRFFGLIGIVRGLAILTRLANESTQPGTTGKGLMHIIAGTLAVNIVGTISLIKATFGFN